MLFDERRHDRGHLLAVLVARDQRGRPFEALAPIPQMVAAQFVEQLKTSHTIVTASVTIGGEKNLQDPAYAHLKDAIAD